MRTLFEIGPEKEPSGDHALLMEIGTHHCIHAFYNKPASRLDGLRYVAFDETESEAELSAVLAETGRNGVQSVVVCSAFPQAMLTPAKFFQQDYALLDAVYGGSSQARFHDPIPEWQLINQYSFPTGLRQLIENAFFSVEMYHAYTPALKIYSGYVADNQLLVHFTEQQFRVLLKKDTSVHLAQTYSYKSPLDVVYFLLKICEAFGLAQQAVHVIVSGLVEERSALYAELQQYFSNVHLTHPPEIAFPGNEHPHHFFTSIFNLAACVS